LGDGVIIEVPAVSIEHRMIQVTEVDNIIKSLDDAYGEALGEKTMKDIVISSAE